MLQPLDACVNKPFKAIMPRKWQEWMLSGEHTLTASGRKRKVELDVICTWIKEAWDKIPQQLIRKSFLKCSIMNALDGSKGNFLWQDEEEDAVDSELLPEDDNELYYANENEVAESEIDEASYLALCGDSDDENDFKAGEH